MASYFHNITLFYLNQTRLNAKITVQHIERPFVSYDLHLWIELTEQTNASCMVGLHVVNNQIIQRTVLQFILYLP